ncbi:MAG: Holliday junction resolvase RuvX [Gammaproteobacteria bacterium]|nr:Holliday junction resolvase RuvX [Gammaproteobacteria bacterium]
MVEIKSVLAFDFGLKRIGVAVGQSITKTAQPLPLLNAENGAPQWEQVQQLIDQWQPQLLVVGVPVHMDGTEQDLTRFAKRFGNRLHGRFYLPVEWVDERLTSYEAESILDDLNYKQSNDKIGVDSVSAMLILEQYFREH